MGPRRRLLVAAAVAMAGLSALATVPARAEPDGGCNPMPESCNGADDDCNGLVDDVPDGGALCPDGEQCVKSDEYGDQCAAQCGDLCNGGEVCETVTIKETGKLGNFCVKDSCGGCGNVTKKDDADQVICAPKGTVLDGCVEPPVCVCKGALGCVDPCFGVPCDASSVCIERGPHAGACGPPSCWNVPCACCDVFCHQGTCMPSPCTPSSCAPDEVCKPSADFTSPTCVPSCAGVECYDIATCKAGVCVFWCNPPCPDGEACDTNTYPPECIPSLCGDGPTCLDGSCCDGLTGTCGDCPCDGVVCPPGQTCDGGDCFSGGAGGGSATVSSASAATTTGTGGAGGAPAAGAGGAPPRGPVAFGGCSCDVPGR